MTDQDDAPQQEVNAASEAHPRIEYVIRERKRRWSPLQRVGCVLGLLLWLLVMTVPFLLFVLAIQGQITIAHPGDVPDGHEHPLLQVKLIMEPDYRGLNITNSSVQRDGENLCVQTDVRFILWQGEGEPASFCDCYTQVNDEWSLETTTIGTCE